MILVTGGTGLVGAHLLFELARKNEAIRATKRHSSDLHAVRKVFGYYTNETEATSLFDKIEWVTANINDIPLLNEAFNDIDVVYHCAALISFDPSDEKKLRRTNIQGTANIVNMCIANNIKKLCYVSSVAALGSVPKQPVTDESLTWNPEEDHSDYAISKYGAEIEVWRSSQEGVDVVIVNPGIIIGPGFWDSGSGQIFSRIDKGLNYHFPKVSGFVGVRDVVKAMIMLTESEIKNEKFILVSENISFEDLLKKVAYYLKKPEPKKQLKKWMVRAGWIFQKIGGWFGMKREITKESVNTLYQKSNYDNSKIKQALNFEFTPVEGIIKETAEIYLSEKSKEENLFP